METKTCQHRNIHFIFNQVDAFVLLLSAINRSVSDRMDKHVWVMRRGHLLFTQIKPRLNERAFCFVFTKR